jgi:hypothetical protein
MQPHATHTADSEKRTQWNIPERAQTALRSAQSPRLCRGSAAERPKASQRVAKRRDVSRAVARHIEIAKTNPTEHSGTSTRRVRRFMTIRQNEPKIVPPAPPA